MRGFVLGFLAVLAIAPPASAQGDQTRGTVAGVFGTGNTWDDEGSIGRGIVAGGRVEWRLFGGTSIEASLDLLTHDRSAGFFQAEGDSTLFGVSLLHRFARGRVQPYVLGGVGLVRHSGTTQFDNLVTVRESTDGAFHFGGGLAVRVGERFEIGPEARFYVIRADHGSDPAWANWIGVRAGVRF